jgi:predicted metal-dependent enzyme (double-stranded beta helix superfamily)
MEIIENARFSEHEFIPFNKFDHPETESYGRNLLYETDKFKIYLMSWKPGDFTAIHNHGITEWGGVYFFGNATHRLYEMTNDKLELIQCDYFKKGDSAAICGDLIHMMGNSGNKEFTTLHIYGSNTGFSANAKDEKVFLPEHRSVFNTNGPAFLNMNEDLKKLKTFFNDIKEGTLLDYFDTIKPFYSRIKRDDVIQTISMFERNLSLYYQ